jgi:hypothetical protein
MAIGGWTELHNLHKPHMRRAAGFAFPYMHDTVVVDVLRRNRRDHVRRTAWAILHVLKSHRSTTN